MVEIADVRATIATTGGQAQGLTRERLRVAAVCMLGLALAASILPFCAMGAALGPMMLEFGWGADRVSLSYAVFMWAGAVSLWPVGVLIDRFGPRPVVAVGATVMAAASLTMPFVRHYWQCPALAVVLGVCGSSGLGYIRIVAALFGARRGLMLGLFAAESTILSQVMPMAMNRLVAADGWRGAFTTIGIGLLAVAPLLYLGLAGRRDGASWSARWSLAPAPPAEGRTARDILRDRLFWTVVAAALATAAIGGGAMTSFAAAMAQKGFVQSAILHAAPLTLVATLAGAICSGLMLDKVGSPRLAAVAFLATAVTYVLWTVVTPSFGGEPILTAALAIGAFAYAAQLPFVGYFLSRYFGLRAFATVCGLQAFMQQAFVGLGSPVIGRSLDLIGGYSLLFEAGIAAQVLAALLYLSLPAYRYPAVGEGDAEDARAPVPRARVRAQ